MIYKHFENITKCYTCKYFIKRTSYVNFIFQPEDYDWDGFVLSNLSHNTANWLVYEKMQHVDDKERVQMMMEEWYGKPDPGQFFREEYDEANASKDGPKKEKKRWKKVEASYVYIQLETLINIYIFVFVYIYKHKKQSTGISLR